ncbi:MAG: hypothetical protein ACLFUB_17570, partial [Cyclobacteriaceae bacterium]
MKKITCLIACLTLGVCLIANAQSTYYVSSDGDNMNDGLSETTAWETINYAVAEAGAGDTINVVSAVDGIAIFKVDPVTINKPLTLRGIRRPQIQPTETNNSFLLSLQASEITVEGLIIDGINQVDHIIILEGNAVLDADTIRQ